VPVCVVGYGEGDDERVPRLGVREGMDAGGMRSLLTACFYKMYVEPHTVHTTR
jgi:hypothetical protein